MQLTRNPNINATEPFAAPLRTNIPRSWWTGPQPHEQLALFGASHGDSQVVTCAPMPNLRTCTRAQVKAYFDNGWFLTELLFSSLADEADFLLPPYHALRHPFIFYYGHPAVLYVNKLRVAKLLDEPLNSHFESIFETGVDEMSWDDMAKNEMEWPALTQVTEYRRRVYEKVLEIIETHPGLTDGHPPITPDHPLWALFLGFEHERIHIETSSALLREFPLTRLKTPPFWPLVAPASPGVQTPNSGKWLSVAAGTAVIGKDFSHPFYGWDNEYGRDYRDVGEFECSPALISNGEYLEFVRSGGYSEKRHWSQTGWRWREFRNVKWPTFWVPNGPQGLHEYGIRTLFSVEPFAPRWPVVVNFHEAQAYASWRSEKEGRRLRLPSEAEHGRLRSLIPGGGEAENKANLALRFGSECDVTNFRQSENLFDVVGNVWQWHADHFHALPGFKIHPYYEDFSTPCFDGEHQMILGGSFAAIGNEAKPEARFHFRPHFFQHAGFRLVSGARDSHVEIAKDADATGEKIFKSITAWEKKRFETSSPWGEALQKSAFSCQNHQR